MRKKLVSLLCVTALVLALALPSGAAEGGGELAADTLYTLGLVQGDGDGYQLDRAPTRLEALVMTVRLAGGEEASASAAGGHPFADVPQWAEGYVSWAYARGLVQGSGGLLKGGAAATAQQCAAMVLRAMGYREEAGDFTYATAGLVACRLGLLDSAQPEGFTRGDLFTLCLAALSARVKGSEATLAQTLAAAGAVEQARLNAVGLGERTSLTARQVADRLSPAVFYMESYATLGDKAAGTPTSNASGFFISADGLALTNQHAIADSVWSEITTTDGETFTVESVLFADKGLDIALIRIAREEDTVFPYLTVQHSDTVHNGDVVYALGSPLGLQNSISSGIVSNRQRELEGFTLPIIQNTAPISEGSSGGVLLNEYGEAIGITSAYFIYGQSMYIAVPLDPVFDLDREAEGISLADYHLQLQQQAEE